MSDYDEDRVPTIFEKHWEPSKPLLKAIIARIENTKDLSYKLPFMNTDNQKQQQIYMEKLAHIIAHHLYYIEKEDYPARERWRAMDLRKKTEERWYGRFVEDSEREKKIRQFAKVVSREIIAKENAKSTNVRPRKESKDYFPGVVKELYDFFSFHTNRPYRYIAAITGLFNLHPRAFCAKCVYFPVQRKDASDRKIQSLTLKVRRGIDMCKLNNIFACPKHETGRTNLRKAISTKIQSKSQKNSDKS
jgi:hypothetical protein